MGKQQKIVTTTTDPLVHLYQLAERSHLKWNMLDVRIM